MIAIIIISMGKGNIAINKSISKEVENGKIVQELPEVEFNGRMYPLFKVISPDLCSECNSPLENNQNYERLIISSYGVIGVPTIYKVCSNPNCKTHHTDTILGVTGSANYSDEFIEKQKTVRYNGRCSLWNSRTVGEIFTEGITDLLGRAPCPTTLWKYEQKQGIISAHELLNQRIDFNGTLYVDGYWLKTGWKKYLEAQLGRQFTKREWKKLRYKIIYVVATEEKVVLDFQICNRNPSFIELLPLLNRIKNRMPEGQIRRFVSDEDDAIIGAVKQIFPNVFHSFCVFHQLKNISKKYFDEFGSIENIPSSDLELYGLANELILAENAIESTIYYRKILKLKSSVELSKISEKVIKSICEIYFNNVKLLKEGFTPETNNVMEQLFSLLNDFIIQARSFKTIDGLANFFYNLFIAMNNRSFNTGSWRGCSPLQRAKIKCG